MKPKLYLINGPLGAGKTTFLREVLKLPEFRNARVIENEFASTSVDTEQLHDHQAEVATIAGMCICCSTGDELADALRTFANDAAPVIIEATGVANSLKLIEKLVIADLLELYTIGGAYFVLDAVEATHHEDTALNPYIDELKAANSVLLSKVDLITPTQKQYLITKLQDYNISHVDIVQEGVCRPETLRTMPHILEYFAQLEIPPESRDATTSYTILDTGNDTYNFGTIDEVWARAVKQYGLQRLKGNLCDKHAVAWHVEATPGQWRTTAYTGGEMRLVCIGERAAELTHKRWKELF